MDRDEIEWEEDEQSLNKEAQIWIKKTTAKIRNTYIGTIWAVILPFNRWWRLSDVRRPMSNQCDFKYIF